MSWRSSLASAGVDIELTSGDELTKSTCGEVVSRGQSSATGCVPRRRYCGPKMQPSTKRPRSPFQPAMRRLIKRGLRHYHPSFGAGQGSVLIAAGYLADVTVFLHRSPADRSCAPSTAKATSWVANSRRRCVSLSANLQKSAPNTLVCLMSSPTGGNVHMAAILPINGHHR